MANNGLSSLMIEGIDLCALENTAKIRALFQSLQQLKRREQRQHESDNNAAQQFCCL